jgi:uncharacterized protein (DUF58 family)
MALLGYAWPGALDLLVAANAGILAAAVVDWWMVPSPRAVVVEREAADSFSVGRESECMYRWLNRATAPCRLTWRETRPEVLGGVQPPRELVIPAREAVRVTLSIRPMRRGREASGWIAVRGLGPLGLVRRQWRVELPWRVIVYPGLPASRLKAAIAEAVRERRGSTSARQLGEGRQFESLREWVPGDDPRHVDWKATARRRKLIVRQYEEERRQHVMLVLDTGRLLTADVGGEARVEHVVRAALWLAFAANHHDDSVGVMAFSDAVHHYVAPERGRRGLRRVLEVLAVINARMVEPDYPGAFRYLAVRNRRRALTVLFTDVIDRTASEALVANVATLRPRHLPLVVTLRNPALDRAATARPRDESEAFRKAAAEELLLERQEALGRMRAHGAVVLDVAPEQASRAVVDRYLELKRRGRI